MAKPNNAKTDGELGTSEPGTCTASARIDGWLASSLMQKAIRRGETKAALKAGERLLELRGVAAFNRLIVTAFEDIGIGSEAAITFTVAAGTDLQHRRSMGGNEEAMARVIEHLSCAAKDRSADYLICSAKLHPSLEHTRECVGRMTLKNRIALATDVSAPITERAVAAWYASGLEWEGERRVGAGDLRGLLGQFRLVGVSESLLNSTAIAARRTKEPIVVMVPVLASALGHCAAPTSSQPTLPSTAVSKGVPLYAFGHHTRIGKQAIRRFVRECTAVRAVIEKHAPDYKAAAVGEMAVYYADAAPVTPKLVWEHSLELERLGRESDFLSAGAPASSVQEICEVVLANLDRLSLIRAEMFEAIPQ